MLARMRDWLDRRATPRAILVVALGLFLLYSWPGFVGWDTREHFVQSRAGHYTDGHPPAIGYLFRFCELFVTGPALPHLLQSTMLLLGLYSVLNKRLSPRPAAIVASVVFLFPYVSGVTGMVSKDPMMAGALLLAIGFMLGGRPALALVFLLAASLLRWNALAATFAPMILLFRWSPAVTGVRRYAIATLAWLAVTFAAYETNELLTDEREYLWHWGYGYVDIAGTLEYTPDFDDATMNQMLDGVPLLYHDHVLERFRTIYNPAYQYHLSRNPGHILRLAANETERQAVFRAWKRIVFGYPGAYLHYRLDNFRQLLAIDRPPSFSNVYVWFNVIAAPEVIDELGYDAGPSKIQKHLIDGSVWLSLTPLYYTYFYFALCLLLAPLIRTRLELALFLSALGYELQWFFLAATADTRYSQWMTLCTFIMLALAIQRRRQGAASIR